MNMNPITLLSILVLLPALQGCIPGKSAEIPRHGIMQIIARHNFLHDYTLIVNN